ncbi:MAG: acylphosphatase [Lachnospiraceae bacterium]|nr:acylphosphatase [Lachnospiraceae bacterium]
MEMIRKQIQFYGRVQGVGFRYHAKHAADSFGLTGWVRNEYDGSVRMEVQGEEELVDRMIQALDEDRYIDIRDMEIKSLSVVDGERKFLITY